MVLKILFVLVFAVGLNGGFGDGEIHSRAKRFGVFNRGGATRVRLIMGFGFPLELEEEAITIGVVIAAQYQLPYNIDGYKPAYFPGFIPGYVPVNQQVLRPFGRFRRQTKTDPLTGQRYEEYDGEVIEVGSEELRNVSEIEFHEHSTFDDEFVDDGKIPKLDNFPKPTEEQLADTSGSRWLLYDGIGKLLNSKGLVGRPCVLRAICDVAESGFTHHSGLFGELLQIAFSPSSTHDSIVNSDHHDYVKAERLGESGKPCAEIFHECKESLLDIFSHISGNKLFDFN